MLSKQKFYKVVLAADCPIYSIFKQFKPTITGYFVVRIAIRVSQQFEGFIGGN